MRTLSVRERAHGARYAAACHGDQSPYVSRAQSLLRRIIRLKVQSSATTLLRSVPMPVMSTSHTSPGFMLRGEPSVPIHITSPG